VGNDFDKIEQEAKLLTDNEQYEDATSRKKCRKQNFDGSNENEILLNGTNAFRTNFHIVICDNINWELLGRSDVYSNTLSPFKALFISNLTENETELCISMLNYLYKDDIVGAAVAQAV
jgi:hypothetical protein